MEQQKPSNFRSCVVSNFEKSIIPNKVIIPDHKLYFVDTDSKEEAHYLCSFLNSRPVRTWLGGFLLGKQIGTTIFEFMKVPQFDPDDEIHQLMAKISVEAHSSRKGTKTNDLLDISTENELEHLVKSALLKRKI